MIAVKWITMLLLSLVFDLIGTIAVAIALPFADTSGKGKLPFWADWAWGNQECGINGDEDRKAEIDKADNGFVKFMLRWHWLAIRNPGNNFGYLMGVEQTDLKFGYHGDKQTSDLGHPGDLFVLAERGGKEVAFCYYSIERTSPTKCFRIFLGWKIHDMVNDGKRAQIVCVVNPFMTFTESPNAN